MTRPLRDYEGTCHALILLAAIAKILDALFAWNMLCEGVFNQVVQCLHESYAVQTEPRVLGGRAMGRQAGQLEATVRGLVEDRRGR